MSMKGIETTSSPPLLLRCDFGDPDRPCTKYYYWCSRGRPSLVECLDGKIFSAIREECVFINNAPDCKPTTKPPAPTTVTTAAAPGLVCPEPFGDFPDPDRPCTKFYYWCENSRASLVECLDDKIYSSERGECAQIENAPDCRVSTPGFVCPASLGDFPDPDRPCTKYYYWCSLGRASLVECLDGKIFSAIREECVFINNAPDCKPSTSAAPTTTTAAAAPSFACPDRIGDFPDPDRPCTKFYYWCENSRASLVECLDGKIYSSVRGECALPENAPDCRVSTPGFVCPASLGDFGDPDRPCTKYYYWCSRGRASLVECLDGKIFSAIREECVFINNAPDCKPPATTTVTTPAAPGFVCPEPVGDFPDPDRPCAKFYYWCNDGQPSLVECLDDKIYSAIKGECVIASDAPDCQPSTPATPGFVCPVAFGDFPDPRRPCTMFYYWCERNRAQVVKCLEGTIFSAIKGKCVTERDAPDCQSSTPATPVFVCPATTFGDFPDPQQRCSKFYYWCQDSKPELVECLDGKIYSPSKEVCDVAENVPECTGSIPSDSQCDLGKLSGCAATLHTELGFQGDGLAGIMTFFLFVDQNFFYSQRIGELCRAVHEFENCFGSADIVKCSTIDTFVRMGFDAITALSNAFFYRKLNYACSTGLQVLLKNQECYGRMGKSSEQELAACYVRVLEQAQKFPDQQCRYDEEYTQCFSRPSRACGADVENVACSIMARGFTVIGCQIECNDTSPAPSSPPQFICPRADADFADPDRPCSRFYYWCDDQNKAELVACPAGLIFNPAIEDCDSIQNAGCAAPSPSDSQCNLGKLRLCAATLHTELGFEGDGLAGVSTLFGFVDQKFFYSQRIAELCRVVHKFENCFGSADIVQCSTVDTFVRMGFDNFIARANAYYYRQLNFFCSAGREVLLKNQACISRVGIYREQELTACDVRLSDQVEKFPDQSCRHGEEFVQCFSRVWRACGPDSEQFRCLSSASGFSALGCQIECKTPASSSPSTVPPTTTPPQFICPRADADFADPDQPCSRFYYWCDDQNKAELVACPAGLIFNPAIEDCDSEQNVVGCAPPTTTAPTRPPVFACPEAFGDFAHPDRPCTKFYYWCQRNQASLVECLDAKIFSAQRGECVQPRNAPDCPSSTSATPGFVCPFPFGDFPDPRRPCTMFYYWCQDNRAQVVKCLEGSIFSAIKGECVTERDAPDCERSAPPSIPPPVTLPTTIPPQFICPRPDADFAHPERPCSKYYYWCDDQNKAELVTCPGGQIFNPIIQDCDVIRNVPQCAGALDSACDFNKMSSCTLSFYSSIGIGGNGITDLDSAISFVYKKFYQPGGVEKFGELCRAVHDLENCFGSGFVDCLSVATFKLLGASEDTAPANVVFLRQQNYVCGTGRPVFERHFDCYARTTIATENEAQECLNRFVQQLTGSPRDVCSFAQEFTDCFIKPYAVCDAVQNAACGMMAAAFAFIPCPINCRAAPSASSPSKFVCPRPDADFADPERPCTKYYYWCDDQGQAESVRCPGSQIYSAALGDCADPRRVPQCPVASPTTSTAAPTSRPAPFLCPQADADFADPARPCSRFYYWCDDQNNAELVACPRDFIFNPTIKDCDAVQNVPGCAVAPAPQTSQRSTSLPDLS